MQRLPEHMSIMTCEARRRRGGEEARRLGGEKARMREGGEAGRRGGDEQEARSRRRRGEEASMRRRGGGGEAEEARIRIFSALDIIYEFCLSSFNDWIVNSPIICPLLPLRRAG